MSANPRNLREVDLDAEELEHKRSRRQQWSVAGLVMPLPMVGLLLLQTVLGTLWLDSKLAPLATVAEMKEIKAEIYKQQDATKDLALRDDRIAEIIRRLELLEAMERRR
jgi:hypothetical protein